MEDPIPSRSPSTRSRAPGHRACIPCARAKAGCVPVVPPDMNNRCERCIRLRKKCELVAVRARVRSRRTGETRAYVQKLEERIDGLVTLIQSRESDGDPHGSLPSDPPLHDHLNQRPALSSGRNSIVSESLVHGIDGDVNALSASNSRSYSMESASAAVSTPQSSDVVNGILSAQEAERCLDLFRTEMSPSFPFIWIEESVTAAGLRRNRPFFFLCIMAVTTGSTDRKNAMRKLITESLARRMYVNNERSLDLLLGILTYLAWSHHLIIYKGQKTALFASASALIIDLEINRPSNLKVSTRDYNLFEAADSNTIRIHQPPFNSFETIEDTAEVRRAFLAHFYLSSISSSLLQQAEPPRVTKYLKDCYQMLIESDDPNDNYAGVLVESQLILERMTQAPWNGDTQPVTVPTQFFIKAMQEQLGTFREKRAKGSQRNTKLLLLCDSMDIYLYKIGMSQSYSSDLELAANNFERLEVLYSCLRAVKSYFDLFLTIPADEYQAMTLHDICLFRHALFALYKLSTFEHENWSLDCCRQTISLGDTLGKLGGQFEQASAAVGFDNHMCEKQDWFTRGAKHLQGVRDYWERKETAELGNATHITTLPAYMQMGDIDLLDDSFMREILGPWDNQSMGYQNFGM